ncbi:triacylglycerol lipase [Corynebacterium pyruviciproducens]|uniref:triacylglycerol lipase n=1 Tax=Corynebacterium pyruviciproducens TaxID=598660 RepID=UPI0023F45B9D|nr:triacylglycerol lipase [Corynebacterium pyruviciproducens]
MPGNAAEHTEYGFPTGKALDPGNDFYTAMVKTLAYKGQYPKGMNDLSCTSDKNPVVLLPGTTTNVYSDFSKMTPVLMEEGYCVYGAPSPPPNSRAISAIPPGRWGSSSIVCWPTPGPRRSPSSATRSAAASCRSTTSPSSAGIRRWITSWGLPPSNNGTTVGGMFDASAAASGIVGFVAGTASQQQIVGSELVNEVYKSGPVTRPGVKYTFIASETDKTVTPYTNSFVDEPGVVNVTAQDHHPGLVTDHNNMTYYEQVIDLAKKALNHKL